MGSLKKVLIARGGSLLIKNKGIRETKGYLTRGYYFLSNVFFRTLLLHKSLTWAIIVYRIGNCNSLMGLNSDMLC